MLRTLRAWIRRNQRDAELAEELAFHLDEEAEERRARGFSYDQARAGARRDLGNVGLIAEDVRATWTWPNLERIAQDLRFGLRGLARNPGFAIIAVVTLGVTIGAATAMYGVVDGVVLQPLPYPRSDDIVQLRQINQSGQQGAFSDPNFEDLRSATKSLTAVAEYDRGSTSVVVDALPVRVDIASVSRDSLTCSRCFPHADGDLPLRSFTKTDPA